MSDLANKIDNTIAYIDQLKAEIVALKAENTKLRAALEQVASVPDFDEPDDAVWTDTAIMLATVKQIAKRAWEGK
jgi:hypothetical protein